MMLSMPIVSTSYEKLENVKGQTADVNSANAKALRKCLAFPKITSHIKE